LKVIRIQIRLGGRLRSLSTIVFRMALITLRHGNPIEDSVSDSYCQVSTDSVTPCCVVVV